jgi:hypothetical protein
MRSQKGSRRIVVRDVAYRWRATGNDGYISIGIWPTNNIGPFIQGNLRYHETWIDNGDGSWSSAGNQIVITNRIIRRIVEHAVAACGYNPLARGKELNLKVLDDVIEWGDAVRGTESLPE